MTLSILAWIVFWIALDAWGDGRVSEQPVLEMALWVGPAVALLALLIRLGQHGFRVWWRLRDPERVAKTLRAAWIFSVAGSALFAWLESSQAPAESLQPVWVRMTLHAGALLVMLWVILPYSTLLDMREDEDDEGAGNDAEDRASKGESGPPSAEGRSLATERASRHDARLWPR